MLQKTPRITLIDLYKKYPYKCPNLSKSQGRNHISKKEINRDSEFSIELQDYKNIIVSCSKVLIHNYLIKGRNFLLPYNLGTFSLKRYKPKHYTKNGVDWKKTNESKKEGNPQMFYYTLSHTDGFRWLFEWKKNRSFKTSTFWRFHAHPKTCKKISKEILDNPLIIYKFDEQIR